MSNPIVLFVYTWKRILFYRTSPFSKPIEQAGKETARFQPSIFFL